MCTWLHVTGLQMWTDMALGTCSRHRSWHGRHSHMTPHRLLVQVLFSEGKFQWKRLENLIMLAREGGNDSGLDLSDTVSDAVRLLLLDERLRTQVG